ncbi:23S rRNA (pseudouridine(1915)-N(3))-methyltransferase RlmH [Patescibacteria group bacterium]|nr:23S rRNA (pseudouridine(1915)-N(3))-methyltransferase RlmH [Patescibacteria group bacterium]MBU1721162.1 23S rRNA (pseudouridine(1915)-N(3))-methyltransferase RlmH [Patescibacteria group bacterium]MBU1900908.1 23S rRNA (pseudouridine(1915)-N(3))-methyltransferase RlmH [Patescibacteria group bacterium]
MKHITILGIGHLKESYWKQAETEYIKRLSPYIKISIIEKKEEMFRSTQERKNIQQKEAETILPFIQKFDMVIALSEDGKQYDSPQFAQMLKKNTTHGEKILFIIGGPLGLDDSIKQAVHISISLSHLTFPHQMVRTILLEQLYRAETILLGKQYHY